MKKILFISYIFPPQNSAESILIAKTMKYFDFSKYSLSVICANPENTLEGMDYDLLKIVPNKISVTKTLSLEQNFFVKYILRLIPVFAKLPDPKISWVFGARTAATKEIAKEKFDIIYSRSSYLSSHIVGLFVKKKSGLPWIVHFSDPWTDNPYKNYYSKFSKFLNKILEKKVIERADGIVFVNERTKKLVMEKYPKEWLSKTIVIPHFFDLDLYPKNIEKSNKFLLMHLGNFYGLRSPMALLRAYKEFLEENPFFRQECKLLLVGFLADCYKKDIQAMNLGDNLEIINRISYFESLKLMSMASVLIVVDAKIKGESMFLPSKLIDYIGAKKPVLAITQKDGETADLIKKINAGNIVEPDNINEIKQAIKHFYNDWRLGKGVAYNEDLLQDYAPHKTSKMLMDFFQKFDK